MTDQAGGLIHSSSSSLNVFYPENGTRLADLTKTFSLARLFAKLRSILPFSWWMFLMSAETESSLATRPSLLARLKDWNQQTAWREFDRGYAPLLRNVARKAGLTDAEADEVAQETLIAVAKKIGEFQHAGNRGSFRAWLYQQARWRIADQFRLRA